MEIKFIMCILSLYFSGHSIDQLCFLFFYESFRAISSDEFSVSLAFTLIGVDHIMFKVEIMSNEDREWHESFSLVLGPDDPVEAVLGDTSTATVTILDQEAAGSLILPAPPVVSCPLQ